MTSGHCIVEFDAVKKRISIALSGSWDGELISRFKSEFEKVMRDCNRHGILLRDVSALVDWREMSLITQEFVPIIKEMIERLSAPVGKSAIIVSSMLAKLQANRIRPTATCAVFLSLDEAIAWLDQTDPRVD